ncbi:ornithine carbamoyltransferase [Candidatus Latescibacterota bacterium]
MNKDLLSIRDLTIDDYEYFIDTAIKIKSDIPVYYGVFEGRMAALIFDKPSLRTRVTFEVAMNQFGGRGIYISGKEISLGKRESISDGARNLSRWVDVIIMRTFGHDIIEKLAESASIPVINALTDLEHPCQALACMLTLKEHLGDLHGKKAVFVGDGNNVAHSLMLLAPLAGMDFTMCCPKGYEPDKNIEAFASAKAAEMNTTYNLEHDPFQAVEGADLIYSDVWVSMGQKDESGKKTEKFKNYQVNSNLVGLAGPDCLVSHCLPAHRDEEITSNVLDSPRSIAFDEAENRLHIQKAILYKLIKR